PRETIPAWRPPTGSAAARQRELRGLRAETNQVTPRHAAQHPVHWIDLELPDPEVQPAGGVVVVVLEQLAAAEEGERNEVPRRVAGGEVAVAVAMATPVHDRALRRPHEPVERQQQELPPRGREPDVEQRDDGAERNAARPRRRHLLERRPFGIVPE